MFGTVITAVISFISTNIDNIFVMILLYAQIGEKLKKRHVVIGQYLALAILVVISLLGAVGLNFVPQKYVGFLGVIPIALGVKEWVSYKKSKHAVVEQDDENIVDIEESSVDAKENEMGQPLPKGDYKGRLHKIFTKFKSAILKNVNPEILGVAIVAIANGADNIGVYIPLFTGYSSWQFLLTIFVFAIMMASWCFLGERITSFPRIKDAIQRCKHIAVPIIFVGLGVYIFIKSGLFGQV